MLDTVHAALAKIEERTWEPGPATSSLELLQQIYRNPLAPLSLRIRCAKEALPFEHPKLAVTAHIDPGDDWAARLDRAIARSNSARVIEARPAPSEESLVVKKELPPVGPAPTPIDAPFPSPRRRG
jgi:hypothetical protein